MNSKIISAIMAIVVIGLGFGCQSEEFQLSEDGYEYKYVVRGEGETPKNGEVVVYNMMYMDEKDSVIFETSSVQPAMVPCDTGQWATMGVLYKAFERIKQGDSILIKIPTQKLFDESFKAAIPPSLNAEGSITFCIGASEILSQEEAQAKVQELQEQMAKENLAQQKEMEAEMLAASAEQMGKDLEIIDAYLKDNNINAQSTESGLRYVIENEGDGVHPETGQRVKVHYTGTLLDGTKFDSSYDREGPLEFPIGLRQVIIGWDEGIALLKKGGKGTLYIPSPLAYGPQARGGVITENSILKFEVELVDIN